jgi:molybdopterin/thiamine biosynthesis adenylyltransferase
LWGTLAQQRLAESKIICLGTTLLATETLKNVILAGFYTYFDSFQIFLT